MGSQSLARHDLPQFYLLVVLYFLQGIPVGLTFGTIPFLVKSLYKETSFTSLGIFSMATYPYSLKILWSPIVDSVWSRKYGRRRSWIIPIQLVSGSILLLLGWCVSTDRIFYGVDATYHENHNSSGSAAQLNVVQLTGYFMTLIFLCATQDIAVDGWALTILSQESLSYAATAQTIGLNMGYFLSFTVFLAFNSNEFINKYFRSSPLPYGWISLGGYLQAAGILYLLVTVYIILFTVENPINSQSILPTKNKDDMVVSVGFEDKDLVLVNASEKSIIYAYKCFAKVLKLGPVQSLVCIHLIAKFAFQCNEAATNLKLLEKGFKKEDLAVTVLIDFPFEIIFGYYVAKWSSEANNIHENKSRQQSSNRLIRLLIGDSGILAPWRYGFIGRLLAAMLGSFVVYTFPRDGEITKGFFLLVIFQHMLGSFMSTVQFVCISSFHTRVADPVVGGTYMTLLNTLSNFGGTWPRFFIMSLINNLTVYSCQIASTGQKIITENIPENITKCVDQLHGQMVIVKDGYFTTNFICIAFGIFIYFTFLKKKTHQLQNMPISSWRCM